MANIIEMENVRIFRKNFRGLERRNPKTGEIVNAEGQRNFCVMIDDPEEAQRMADDGLNIKILAPQNEGDEPKHYLPVTVRYDNFPPKIYMIMGHKKVLLDEEMLDGEDSPDVNDIDNVDVIINLSNWTRNGASGIKAYVKTMYITYRQDSFASKYDYDDPADMGELPF